MEVIVDGCSSIYVGGGQHWAGGVSFKGGKEVASSAAVVPQPDGNIARELKGCFEQIAVHVTGLASLRLADVYIQRKRKHWKTVVACSVELEQFASCIQQPRHKRVAVFSYTG